MATQVEHTCVQTRVGPLHVRQRGEGPVAVLWHSLFIDSTSWQRVEADLAEHRRLVLIDGPGHGLSGDPGHRDRMEDCAQAALDVLDHLEMTGEVDWVGNAWGGHVGIVAAADRPGRLRSLVALGTPIRAYAPAERRRVHLLSLAYRLLGPARFLTEGVADVQLSPTTRARDAEAAVRLTTEFLVHADRRRLNNAIRSISLGRHDLSARLPRIDIPTLIVTGSDHSGFTPEEAREVAARIRGGRRAVVSNAAYLIPLKQPAATTRLIVDFWRSN